MGIKGTVLTQYQGIVNKAASGLGGQNQPPPEGWIATVRKALGMSGPQLAKRVGVTRARISQMEQAEREGRISLKAMQAVAEALGCRLVYSIIPEGKIENIVAAQARKKAQRLVAKAGSHMALESQSLSEAQSAQEVERIANELVRAMPSDLWTDK